MVLAVFCVAGTVGCWAGGVNGVLAVLDVLQKKIGATPGR